MLLNKNGSFPSTLGKGKWGEIKGCCFNPPESQEVGEDGVLMSLIMGKGGGSAG